ncbi:hypothetical protein [Haloterrigena turkmenica]|uniref:hypothetical protein n=1 Tax=Haloterrigena turkmenica TaxID=62320 RepID=UPI0006780423|nr:hypothetical protein [Haloterrigena turkmenica]
MLEDHESQADGGNASSDICWFDNDVSDRKKVLLAGVNFLSRFNSVEIAVDDLEFLVLYMEMRADVIVMLTSLSTERADAFGVH